MKAIFSPAVDRIEDAIHFVEFCYESGRDVHIETQGTPAKRKRRSPRKREESEPVIVKEEPSFEEELAAIPTTNGAAKPKQNKKPGRTNRKKRAPHITKAVYDAIKAGNPEVIQKYSSAAVHHITATRNWSHFLSKKIEKARKSRESKKHAVKK